VGLATAERSRDAAHLGLNAVPRIAAGPSDDTPGAEGSAADVSARLAA